MIYGFIDKKEKKNTGKLGFNGNYKKMGLKYNFRFYVNNKSIRTSGASDLLK